ncbi:MAG: FAD:protein FMN transferase [Lachnospiraceae bacterium]|nr:FAD:protein FMN transferase [Lachnospiraceae bacterium]
MEEAKKRKTAKTGWFAFIGLLFAVVVIGVTIGTIQRRRAEEVHTKELFAMDTYFSLKAYGSDAEEALSLCEERTRELEALLSVTAQGSDVWRIDHGDHGQAASGQAASGQTAAGQTASVGTTEIAADTYRVMAEALELGSRTGGALDITLYPVLKAWGFTAGEYRIPEREELEKLLSRVDYREVRLQEEAGAYYAIVPEGAEVDLGAVAKGYTGDVLIDILRRQGVTSAILDLGGNVQTLGTRPDGTPWRVAVRDPFDRSQIAGVLDIEDKCVITSGGYERYFTGEDGQIYWHILDPATGEPARNGLLSVTIVGDHGVRCDAYSTALFVMGRESAVDFWRQQGDFEMILVCEDGEMVLTEGLRDRFTCADGWEGHITYVDRDNAD